jgi:hypothetical protein
MSSQVIFSQGFVTGFSIRKLLEFSLGDHFGSCITLHTLGGTANNCLGTMSLHTENHRQG